MITGVRVVADRLICSVIHRCVRCDRSAAYRRVDYVRINRIDRIDRMARMNIRKGIAARVRRSDINAVNRYAYQMVMRTRRIVNGCVCSLKNRRTRRNRSVCRRSRNRISAGCYGKRIAHRISFAAHRRKFLTVFVSAVKCHNVRSASVNACIDYNRQARR